MAESMDVLVGINTLWIRGVERSREGVEERGNRDYSTIYRIEM